MFFWFYHTSLEFRFFGNDCFLSFFQGSTANPRQGFGVPDLGPPEAPAVCGGGQEHALGPEKEHRGQEMQSSAKIG